MTYQTITLERRGPVAWLSLNRPDQGNAISRRMLRELGDACQEIEEDDTLLVALIVGNGPAFSVGWDESEFLSRTESPEGPVGDHFASVSGLTKPVIAALSGDVVSGGLELALTADIRIASEGTRFAFPETGWGIVPLAGGVQRLVRLVGRATALEMLLAGESLDAREALATGLVSKVTPADRLMAAAESLADHIAARGPVAVRYAKEAVQRGMEMPLEQALRFETDLTVILQTTDDRAEGVRAFVEKRLPRFTGR